MTDMGGLYRIAEAMTTDPERLELDGKVCADRLAIDRERMELDRRALALREACGTVQFDFKRDDEREQHEKVLTVAKAYYQFLSGENDS